MVPDLSVDARRLQFDPEFQGSESGRALLRLLLTHMSGIGDWERMIENVPGHRGDTVAELALRCSKLWEEFADRVEGNVEIG